MTKRKAKIKIPQEGDLMRVKDSGMFVRLVASKDNDKSLIDKDGFVYVEPAEPVDDWYHIDDLERVR